ncbi:MAG: hypothetical protein PF689_10900 [Deltaproteobacteria bacterium]|nr:hypothetical protein [Deltaproteobacteria bacterium]
MEINKTIESLAGNSGNGIIHHNNHTYFVPATVPGDQVMFEDTLPSSNKRWHETTAKSLVEPSPERIKSPCSLYPDDPSSMNNRCGGCPWMCVSTKIETQSKLEIWERALRQTEFDWEKTGSIISIPSALGYRTRNRLAFANKKCGYRQSSSNRLVYPEKCPILKYSNNFKTINEFLPAQGHGEIKAVWNEKGEFILSIQGKCSENQSELQTRFAELENKNLLGIKWGRYQFGSPWLKLCDSPDLPPLYLNADSFYQPGIDANLQLLKVLGNYLDKIAKLDSIVEFHAGAGNFTRLLAQKAEVVAVESQAQAVEAFRKNFAQTVKVIQIKDKKFKFFKETDLIVLDPPRTGLSKQMISKIGSEKVKNLILFSCDPMAGKRDLDRLSKQSYQIKDITLVNTMPKTPHFEIVSRLEFID